MIKNIIMEEKKILKGGEFLIKESNPRNIFIPEEFDEEQKMIMQTCQDFLETEVFPVFVSWSELPNFCKKSIAFFIHSFVFSIFAIKEENYITEKYCAIYISILVQNNLF